MKKLLLALLFACTAASAQSIKLGDLPLGLAGSTNQNDSIPFTDSGAKVSRRMFVHDTINIPAFQSVARLASPTFTGVVTAPTFVGALTGVASGNELPLTFSSPISRSVNTISIPVATSSVNGYLSLTDWGTFNSKQDAGSYLTALTSDVSASGPGSAAATVNSIGGSSASNVHSAELAANAATAVNTASTILKRDGSGQVAATTFTGALTGTASGNESPLTFSAPLSRATNTISCIVATGSVAGCLSAADWTTFNGKQASGNYITALTSDVSASGPGSAAATVNSVGGSTSSLVHSAELAANAATAVNTASTILKRDGSGQVAATTFTGALTGHASLDLALTGGTMAGAIAMGTSKITGMGDPTLAQDAATKTYVDSQLSYLNPADSVYAASSGSGIAGTYTNAVSGVCIGDTFQTTSTTQPFVVDGATPSIGSRILLKDQTSSFQDGVWTLTVQAVAGVSGAIFTRALDMDTAADFNAGQIIPIINGTVNAGASYFQTATVSTCNSDSQTWTQFQKASSAYLLKASNLSDVTTPATAFNNISPMTALGDTLYGGASGAGTKLAGNTTSSLNIYTQTGTGSVSAAPAWASSLSGSFISGGTFGAVNGSALTTLNASNLSSGTVAAARLPNPSSSTLGGIESYASVSNQWINAISTSGVPSSTQPDYSNLSGTDPVGQGGTGQTTYTDGQLLIGNTTGNTLAKATLTAGSGITVTNGHGTITVASSASGGLANPTSEVLLTKINSLGGTNTAVIYFINNTVTGSDLSYTASSSNGDKVVVNTAGVYCVDANDNLGASILISKNSSVLIGGSLPTTAQGSLKYSPSGYPVSTCLNLAVNDIIRLQATALSGQSDYQTFRITRVN